MTTTTIPPYLKAADALGADERIVFEQWHAHAERVGGEAGLVLQSLAREQQLERHNLKALLKRIVEEYLKVIADLTDEHPVAVFEVACSTADLHCQGPIARLSDKTILRRVVNIRDLKELVFTGMSKRFRGPGRVERAWDQFRASSEEDQLEILRLVGLEPCDYFYWAYIDENAPADSASDPLAKLSAAECCNRLGLSEGWRKYAPGEQLWKIHYLPSKKIIRLVPTLIDACVLGWNRYFVPCVDPRSVAKWGRTGPLDGASKGLPEVIHRGWERRTEPAAFFMMPEQLGAR